MNCRCIVLLFDKLVRMQYPLIKATSIQMIDFDFESAGDAALHTETPNDHLAPEVYWSNMRSVAEIHCAQEPVLSAVMSFHVLSHDSLSAAVAHILAHQFQNHLVTVETWVDIFQTVLVSNTECRNYMESVIVADLEAVATRDPAATDVVQGFIYSKGFKALQSYRVAHVYWKKNRKQIALLIQSRCSELYGVDIHPNATIGPGMLIDHATAVTIGETAVIGKDCTMLHSVTLGATGKTQGDRHPKLGDRVMVGCGASVLGNIHIGSGAKIGAGSIVLKDVLPMCTVVGNPARIVGVSVPDVPSDPVAVDYGIDAAIDGSQELLLRTWSIWSSGKKLFDKAIRDHDNCITLESARKCWSEYVSLDPDQCLIAVYEKVDVENRGLVDADILEDNILKQMRKVESLKYFYQI